MPKFTIEVEETTIYRGVIEAATEEEAREAALADVIEYSGDEPGDIRFVAVVERQASKA